MYVMLRIFNCKLSLLIWQYTYERKLRRCCFAVNPICKMLYVCYRFHISTKILVHKLTNQGFKKPKLRRVFEKFATNNYELLFKYNKSLKYLLHCCCKKWQMMGCFGLCWDNWTHIVFRGHTTIKNVSM